MWQEVIFRTSTKQTNQNVERQMEAQHRSSLAPCKVGLHDKKMVLMLSGLRSRFGRITSSIDYKSNMCISPRSQTHY